jgi:hypothetical protein
LINTCRQVPLLVNFYEKPTYRVWYLYRYFVHADLESVGAALSTPLPTSLNIKLSDPHLDNFHSSSSQLRKSGVLSIKITYCM